MLSFDEVKFFEKRKKFFMHLRASRVDRFISGRAGTECKPRQAMQRCLRARSRPFASCG